MAEILHQERFDCGSKYITFTVSDEGYAIVTILTENIELRTPGETTTLFRRVAEAIQLLSNDHKLKIVQGFSTRNENMKLWLRSKGVEMGFTILSDGNNVLTAEKIYVPQ